jgi:hypothetical protein
MFSLFILNPAFGQGGVCGFWGAGQGATTRNGHSIPRRCNAAMCRKNRAIRPVANSPYGKGQMTQKVFMDHCAKLKDERSTARFRFIKPAVLIYL